MTDKRPMRSATEAALHACKRALDFQLETNIKHGGSGLKTGGFSYIELPDWHARQLLSLINLALAGETRKAP